MNAGSSSVDSLQWLLDWVKATTGITIDASKHALIEARLRPSSRAAGFDSLDAYLEHLRTTRRPTELRAAANRLATHTTSFFREPSHFAILERLLPRLGPGRTPLIWSAACSSGEEPFSIALMGDQAAQAGYIRDVRILATDLSEDVLDRARRAVYPPEKSVHLKPEVRKALFEKAPDGNLRIRAAIKNRVEFRPLNLIQAQWGLQVRFDFIFCRNVLFYFDAATQRHVVNRLLNHVRPGGFLVLGHADSFIAQGMRARAIGPTFYQCAPGRPTP